MLPAQHRVFNKTRVSPCFQVRYALSEEAAAAAQAQRTGNPYREPKTPQQVQCFPGIGKRWLTREQWRMAGLRAVAQGRAAPPHAIIFRCCQHADGP